MEVLNIYPLGCFSWFGIQKIIVEAKVLHPFSLSGPQLGVWDWAKFRS